MTPNECRLGRAKRWTNIDLGIPDEEVREGRLPALSEEMDEALKYVNAPTRITKCDASGVVVRYERPDDLGTVGAIEDRIRAVYRTARANAREGRAGCQL